MSVFDVEAGAENLLTLKAIATSLIALKYGADKEHSFLASELASDKQAPSIPIVFTVGQSDDESDDEMYLSEITQKYLDTQTTNNKKTRKIAPNDIVSFDDHADVPKSFKGKYAKVKSVYCDGALVTVQWSCGVFTDYVVANDLCVKQL